MIRTYPDDCPQAYVSPWWIEKKGGIEAGRLVRSYLPHVPQVPMALIPRGRTEEARQHQLADCEIVPMHSDKVRKRSRLPVAGLPVHSQELLSVYRVKNRPALIISLPGPEFPDGIMRNKPGWMSAPLLATIPSYGIDEGTGKRSGFPKELINRVKRCEYPHLFWDMLPLPGNTSSIFRIDHLQPLSAHYSTFETTPWVLHEEALIIVKEWVAWHILDDAPFTGKPASLLSELRDVLQPED